MYIHGPMALLISRAFFIFFPCNHWKKEKKGSANQ